MASSASRSKKWPGPARPSRPRSMMRKNGSSAAKSSRPAIGLFMRTLPFLPSLPGRSGSGGALGEGAEVGDMTDPGPFGLAEEPAHQAGEVDAEDGRDKVQPRGPAQR